MFWIIDVRWNKAAKAAKATEEFKEHDIFCGPLEEAKALCVLFCREKRVRVEDEPIWLPASDSNGPVYFMHAGGLVSFRIRQ